MSKKVLIFILTGTFLCTVIAGLILWTANQRTKFSPETLYQEGMEFAEKGDPERAVIFLKKAIEKLPDNRQIIWQLANLESTLKNSSEAQAYAQKAWKGGKKDRECFLLLIDNSGLPSIELKVEYGQRLLEEIPAENIRTELKGDMFYALQNYEDAENVYSSLYVKEKTPELLLKNAIVKIKLKENEDAVRILEQGVKDESIDSKGLSVLVSLKYLMKESGQLEYFYKLADEKNLDGPEFLYRKSFIYLLLLEEDKALKTLKFLLAKDGINSEDARKARLLVAFIHFDNDQKDKLREILQSLKNDDSPQAEAENLFIKLLIELNLGSPPEDLSNISGRIYRISKLMPDSFIIQMVKARVETLNGNYDLAVKFYDSVTEPVHRIWSRFILDNALTLQKSGKFRRAMNLILAYHTLTKKGSLESLIMLRNLYVALGNFGHALKLQEFLLKTFPENYELKLQTGYISVHKGDFIRAEKDFRGLLDKAPERFIKPLNSAFFKVLLKNSKYQEVLAGIDKMSGKFPDFLVFKAGAQASTGNFKAAEKTYASLIQKAPGTESSRAYSFYILNRNRVTEAEKLFNDAREKWPESGWPYLGLATIAMNKQDYLAAESMLTEAVKDTDEYNNASLLQAEIDFIKGNYRKAIDNLGLIEIYKPGIARLHEIKALCFLSLNKYEDSLKSVMKSIKLRPTASKTLILIRNLIALGRLEEAEKHSLALIEIKLETEMALELFVNIKIFQKKYETAIKKINSLEDVISESAKVIINNSITLASEGEEAAMKELEKNFHLADAVFKWLFLKASKGGDFVKKAEEMKINDQDWSALAFECIKRKDFRNAAACFSHIQNINNPTFLNNYAWSLYKTGDFLKAYEIARKAYRLEPRNSQIIDTYGKILVVAKKHQECINLLMPRVAGGDEREGFLLLLGNSFEGLNNKKMALDFYSRLLSKMDGKEWNLDVTRESIESKLSELKQ